MSTILSLPEVLRFSVCIAQFTHNYDIGGTTACVVAGRLLSAKPDLKILFVEAGPHTHNNLSHIQPARYITHLRPDSKTVRLYQAKESEALGGRAIVVPAGQCIGGGSSVNCEYDYVSFSDYGVFDSGHKVAMYTRAAASDYDDWEAKYHNPGWGSKEVLPLLKKVRTMT